MKGTSALVCLSSLPLAVGYSGAARASGVVVEPEVLLGFKGDYATAVTTTEQGDIVGLIRSRSSGATIASNTFQANTDNAVIWHSDGSCNILDLPEGYSMPQIQSVSSLGVSCGTIHNEKGVLQAFIWDGGLWSGLHGLEDHGRSRASCVNADKIVVGNAMERAMDLPVYWDANSNQTPKRLPIPAGANGVALGINDQGTIVGQLTLKGSTLSQPAVWLDKDSLPYVMENTGPVVSSYAVGVSSDGRIFGAISTDNRLFRAAYWSRGRPVLINESERGASRILSVSEGGIAVGTCMTSNRDIKLFAWRDGREVELKGLGGKPKCVFSVNNANHVACGMSQTATGDYRAVTWHVGNL